MSNIILLTITLLLLISYAFELTSERTRIPNVLLLLFIGLVLKELALYFNFTLFNFSPLLPILGTLGLILIVLEGSLDLEFTREKKNVLAKTFSIALIPIVILVTVFTFMFQLLGNVDFRSAILNAIPFCVISSAIAIPSARFFHERTREFIIYESSFSDILGVILFNFFATNTIISLFSIGRFFLELLIMLLISMAMTLLLARMIYRIQYHIKFIPIILFIILTYGIAKIFHLPALMFILFFGLIMNNFRGFYSRLRFLRRIAGENIYGEITRFKEIVAESTFLVRSLFFLLFGFQIGIKALLNFDSFPLALMMVAIILVVRATILKPFAVKEPILIYFAPRGLITIILFLSIEPQNTLPFVNNSLTVQVILLAALFLMFGVLTSGKYKRNQAQELEQ